jgi:hypothetical protein
VAHTVPPPSGLHEQIARLLDPLGAGRSEAKLLTSLLCRPKKEPQMAAELVAAVQQGKAVVGRTDEPSFLRRTSRHATEELELRLSAIDAYESLCRPITDGCRSVTDRQCLRFSGTRRPAVTDLS